MMEPDQNDKARCVFAENSVAIFSMVWLAALDPDGSDVSETPLQDVLDGIQNPHGTLRSIIVSIGGTDDPAEAVDALQHDGLLGFLVTLQTPVPKDIKRDGTSSFSWSQSWGLTQLETVYVNDLSALAHLAEDFRARVVQREVDAFKASHD